jgi:hypothetical protein
MRSWCWWRAAARIATTRPCAAPIAACRTSKRVARAAETAAQARRPGASTISRFRDQVQALAAAGIATVVVALPGAADFTSVFDDLARAGGRPGSATGGAYPSGVTAAEIEATMTAIFAGLDARCEAPLPAGLSAADVAHVAVGCALRPDATTAGSRVVLEADVCAALGRASPPAVNVLHACTPAP